jgi:hypothetical protein
MWPRTTEAHKVGGTDELTAGDARLKKAVKAPEDGIGCVARKAPAAKVEVAEASYNALSASSALDRCNLLGNLTIRRLHNAELGNYEYMQCFLIARRGTYKTHVVVL